MTPAYKQLVTAGLLAAFGLAAHSQTAPPAPDGAAMTRAQHGPMDPARMSERMARRQAALKQKLQLTPAQEGGWTAYTASLKPPARMQRPDRAEFDKLTTPERIDRMRSLHAARAAEMDKRADATKTFYAALSPEQKKVFDSQAFHGHRGGPRHHKE